jgi:hypothetical protein
MIRFADASIEPDAPEAAAFTEPETQREPDRATGPASPVDTEASATRSPSSRPTSTRRPTGC